MSDSYRRTKLYDLIPRTGLFNSIPTARLKQIAHMLRYLTLDEPTLDLLEKEICLARFKQEEKAKHYKGLISNAISSY